MSFLDWTEQYSVSNTIIDQQHQKLVNLINNLHTAMSNGEGEEYIGSLLGDLVAYTKYHFSAEESIMKTHNYPGLEEHQEKHRKMTEQVLKLQQRHHNGERLTLEVMHFLRDWLTKHILKTDKQYVPYVA